MSFLTISGFIMSVVYTGLGIFLLFADTLYLFTSLQQVVLATLLIAYGLFRLYKAYNRWREELEEIK